MFNGSPSTPLEHRVIQKMLDPFKNYSSKNTSTSFRKFELQVCIDLGDGTRGFIKLDANSNPLQCALEFCEDYKIDKSVAPLLAESIINQLRQEVNDSRNSPVLKHNLSQSMVEEARPELREITEQAVNTRDNRRRQSGSACETRTRSRKSTEPCIISEVDQVFSYRPKINSISKQIAQKLKKKSIVDSTQENQRRREMKVAKMRKQTQFKEIRQCSFKPKINEISEKVDKEIHRNTGQSSNKRYQQLYVDSFIRQISKQHSRKTSYERNSFKPEINRISKTIMTGLSFEQRRQEFKKKPQSKKSTIVFKPKTGRIPKQRNLKQLPIGQYLYEQGRERLIQRAAASANNSRRPSIVSTKSQELYNNLKVNRLREVFELLDEKGSGVLVYDELDFQSFDKETFSVFEPIFQEMKQIEVSLNLEEFIEAGSRLIHNLTPYKRGILFNTKKKPQTLSKFPFHPHINKSSKQPRIDRKDIYIRCLMEKKRQKERVSEFKQQLARNEVYQCTFKPRINRLGRLH